MTSFPGFDEVVEIGRGGFGVVFRARDVALGRTVAIKRLDGRLDSAGEERFRREARAMSALSGHPNVVPIHSVGEDHDGHPYFVMAFVAGGSYGAVVDRGPLPWPEAVRVAVRLAGAVESAHRIGVLHRDIKPDNVLRSDYGEPLLTDFGIARVVGEFATSDQRVTALVAAAPEILSGGDPTPATDVYGIGATLFHLLWGAPPFSTGGDETFAEVYGRIANGRLPELREAGVPHPVAAVVEQAMATTAGDRPATALELGHRLQAAERSLAVAPSEMAVLDPPTAGAAEPAGLASPDRSASGLTPTVISGAADTRRDLTVPTERRPSPPATTAPAGGGPVEPDDPLDEQLSGDRFSALALVAAVLGPLLVIAIIATVVLLSRRTDPQPPTAGPNTNASNGSSSTESSRSTTTDLTPGAPAPITAAGTTAGGHVASGEASTLRFTATAGQSVLGSATTSAAPPSPLELDLLSPDGSPLAQEPVSGTQADSGPVALATTGTYTLTLSPPAAAVDVTLAVALAPPEVTAAATIGGPPVVVALEQPHQQGRVSFEGSAGAAVVVAWQQTGGTASYVSLSLTDTGGSPRTSWSVQGAGSSSAVTLAADGTYTVLVSFDGDATGTGTVAVTG